jgi:hypothetical protein
VFRDSQTSLELAVVNLLMIMVKTSRGKGRLNGTYGMSVHAQSEVGGLTTEGIASFAIPVDIMAVDYVLLKLNKIEKVEEGRENEKEEKR